MKKLLLICSAVAMTCGDYAWGMGDDLYANPWREESASKSRRNIGAGENPNMARRNSGIISAGIQKLKSFNPLRRSKSDSQLNNENLRQKNYTEFQVMPAQTEQSWSGQTQANPQQLQENRFIKIESEHARINGTSAGPTGAVLNNTYLQYHYVLSDNSKIGQATPTTVTSVTDDLKSWNDISEIRYANDVSYDHLENPKVILYRNKDNSCYIILRTDDGKKYGVFYGLNERNVEIGRNSFAVYEISDDVGSFTDGVERLIYVDESGLYFVPENENPVEDVTETYQNEGKFNFKGSVIKVSAIDGTITWNGEPVTEDNFFDNWIWENNKTILSTNQPKSNEILRNFYPPKGNYTGIYAASRAVRNGGNYNWLSSFSGRNWLDSFIKRHGLLTKAKSKNGAKELICDGIFSSILSRYDEAKALPFRGLDGPSFYDYRVLKAIATQVEAKGGDAGGKTIRDGRMGMYTYTISTIIKRNSNLFKDPEFVRSLKPEFSKLEKNFEKSRITGFEEWIPFEIVRNL